MTCPTCGCAMLTCNPSGYFCPHCWKTAEELAQTPKAPQKGAQGQDEASLVRDIVQALRAEGRTVLRVGQYRADMAGQTAGTPDLFCFVPLRDTHSLRSGLCGYWVGIEVKTAAGRLGDAQRALVEKGMVAVARSIEDAFEICEETL